MRCSAQPDVLSTPDRREGLSDQARAHWRQSLRIWVGDQSYAAEVTDPRSLRSRKARADAGKGPRHLVAPMPGKVVRFLVERELRRWKPGRAWWWSKR